MRHPPTVPVERLLVLLALVAGCAAPPAQEPAAPGLGGDATASWYRQAAAAGQQVHAVDPAQSLIAITVRRGGPLARLGHDHVVASRSLTGFAAPAAGRADLQFRLDQMTVDEPALRSEAALDTQPSAAAIEGTRINMLKVLEAERFPLVLLHAERVPGNSETLLVAITLHGVTRAVEVPAWIDSGASGITASGTLQLRQTDFGIVPMSVLGGAMTVQDTLELRFRIVARPALPSN
jgi:polyisoprenoid-binding protein YceI